MGVSIALYGIRLKNKSNGRFVSIKEKNIFEQNILELFYEKFSNDIGKDKEIGHPEINDSKIYNVKRLKKLENGNIFGKISYGETVDTDIDILKRKEQKIEIEKITLNKKNGVVAPNFHFYMGPLAITENGKKEEYLLLLLQKTNKLGIKSSVVEVYKKIVDSQLKTAGYVLEIKVFNYENYQELLKKSMVREITVFIKDFPDIRAVNEIEKMYETKETKIENIIKIKKINGRLDEISEKIFHYNFDEENIKKICTNVKVNGKIKTVNLKEEYGKIEANQTTLDVTEKYEKCDENFEKVLKLFEEEYNDIKVGVGDGK